MNLIIQEKWHISFYYGNIHYNGIFIILEE